MHNDGHEHDIAVVAFGLVILVVLVCLLFWLVSLLFDSTTSLSLATHVFVWTPGLKHPWPRVQHGTRRPLSKELPQPLFQKEITPEQAQLPLDELAKLFPLSK